MRTSSLLLLIAGALGLSGCGRGDRAPDCKAAANAYASLLAKQVDLDHAGDEARKAEALSLIPSLKQEMTNACEKATWSEESRRCIVAAKGMPDLERCMPNVPLEGGSAQPPPAAQEGAAPEGTAAAEGEPAEGEPAEGEPAEGTP